VYCSTRLAELPSAVWSRQPMAAGAAVWRTRWVAAEPTTWPCLTVLARQNTYAILQHRVSLGGGKQARSKLRTSDAVTLSSARDKVTDCGNGSDRRADTQGRLRAGIREGR
jgi:hypothetical protein